MSDQTATTRAEMPKAANPILERRTVENGNRNLLKHLKPGLSVLDVGCGSGAITRGIAELVGAEGRVLGIDPSGNLIAQARQHSEALPQLDFQQADIYGFETTEQFDIVTCARVLQWLAKPEEALARMAKLVKPGGFLAVLDYNHEKVEWTPEPPEAMKKFYGAFLKWREEAGFDNAIADHLKDQFLKLGFEKITVEPQFEISVKSEPTFATASRIWSEVAELRGPQLVKDGYVSEEDRLAAIEAYDQWIATTGESMRLYLLAVEAKK
ncbi:methyltransferase domain-containing protein [Larkinella terrae]|uniref:Methyltransferase domain-containing protein n=1 Tax=Larkinella terrae TaxID=2025311 RepID=A0A7K0EFX3_9BACT|nr:methyltransferase domain-containing protein [Larkinella terrae]MRS60749.1 methyltransferase domain-containing protein [Larkinella terrae]